MSDVFEEIASGAEEGEGRKGPAAQHGKNSTEAVAGQIEGLEVRKPSFSKIFQAVLDSVVGEVQMDQGGQIPLELKKKLEIFCLIS